MSLHRRLNLLTCLAVFAAIYSYVVSEQGAAVLLGWITLPAVVAGWWVGRSRPAAPGLPSPTPVMRRLALPREVVTVLVLLAIGRAAFAVLRTGSALVSDLSEFLVYIQLVKLFDRRAIRDDAQCLSLSVFIAIGAILTGNSLLVGLLLVLYVPLVMLAAMVLQLAAGFEITPVATAVRQTPSPVAARGQRMRPAFAVAAAKAIATATVLAAIAFLIMPRGLGQDVLGKYGVISSGPEIGFTDQVSLSKGGRLREDTTPVMEVAAFDGTGAPLGRQLSALYLRGAVNNRYDPARQAWRFVDVDAGRRGRNGAGGSGDTGRQFSKDEFIGPDMFVSLGAAPENIGRFNVTELEVSLRNASNQYLFTLWRPFALSLSRSGQVRLWEELGVLRMTDRGSTGRLTYRVRSAPDFMDVDARPHQVSFPLPRIKAEAERIVREKNLSLTPSERTPFDNRQIAQSIQNWLRDTYTYSLEMEVPNPGEDPIEMFLFRTRQGHCEYFASAMAAMCQSVGIDARIVAGYVATEYSSSTGRYTVRESNAHAWIEAEIETGRWGRFDPTPPSELERRDEQIGGLFGRIRRFYEALEFRWVNSVVLFDEKQRTWLFGDSPMALTKIKDRATAFWMWVKGLLPSQPVERGLIGWLSTAGLFGFVMTILIALWRAFKVLFRGILERRRGRKARDAEFARLLRSARFYARLVKCLDAAGLRRPDYLGPAQFVQDMPAAPDQGASTAFRPPSTDLRRIVELYYAIRFGRRSLTADELSEADGIVTRIEDGFKRRS